MSAGGPLESVIIASPRPLDFRDRLRLEVGISTLSDGTVLVENGGSRVYIREVPSVRGDYEPDELASILRVLPDPHFYMVDFSDLALCKRVLLAAADDAELLVDTDHGEVSPGDRFAERLRTVVDWDWRRNTPTRLIALLDALAIAAPGFRQTCVRELVKVWELRVALEILCDNLSEHGVELPPALQRRLVAACRQANADARYWAHLDLEADDS